MSPFKPLFSVLVKPLSIMLFVLILLLAYFRLDQALAQWLMGIDLRHSSPILNGFNIIGESPLWLILFFTLGIYFRYIHKSELWEDRSWFLFLCLFFPVLICSLLKVCLGRARPLMWLSEKVYGFYGFSLDYNFWSFPSGHTTTVMSLVFGLSLVFPRFGFTFVITGLLIISTRILLLHHYLSDVLASTYIVMLELGLLLYLRRLGQGPTKPLKQESIPTIDSPPFR